MTVPHEVPGEGTAASAMDPARVARFRRVATPSILAFLVLFTVGTLCFRALVPHQDGPDLNRIIGETYTNVYLYFGAPQREESDGKGGAKLHYDEFQVVGDHFEKREFRIFVNTDGRVYQFERD